MNKKILVIEDDRSALRLLEYALEQEGYQVLTATNGLAGIRKAQNEEPDLIVLDIMLPGIDGFEICNRLRTEPQTAQLPILMVSAKAQEVDKATGLRVGADDYLTKPVDPPEIISRVETLLAQKTTTRSKITTFIGSKGRVGTTTIVVNVAIALSQKGKRVIVVDACLRDGGVAEQLGLEPKRTIAELLTRPMETIGRSDVEAALAVHHTGVKLLTIPFYREHEEILPSNVDLLFEQLRKVTDLILVDLPSPPSELARAILTKCDLAIIVTDSKVDALSTAKLTARLLERLGITKEIMGAVIIDWEGMFPEWEVSKIKPSIERNIGISLVAVVPYVTKASLEFVPGSTPVILSDPNCPIAWSIRGVAECIIAEKTNSEDSS